MKRALRWLDLVVYLAFVALAVLTGPRVATWYVGLCLSVASVPLWFLARWQLGEAFSATATAHKLVTRGLYSKVRHPVYVFGTLAWLGTLLALLSWAALIIAALVAVIEVRRAKREERVLTEEFGSEYLAYRSKTWF